jgi:hypothetical protein
MITTTATKNMNMDVLLFPRSVTAADVRHPHILFLENTVPQLITSIQYIIIRKKVPFTLHSSYFMEPFICISHAERWPNIGLVYLVLGKWVNPFVLSVPLLLVSSIFL